jgi:hypothetical protein
VLALIATAVAPVCPAADDTSADAKAALLQRLMAVPDDEPLAAVCAADLASLPAKFSRTWLNAMLTDETYKEGRATLGALITEGFGAEIGALWPDFSRLLSGPAMLAAVPERPARAGDPGARLVFFVAVPTEEAAQLLAAQWPKAPPKRSTVLGALKLEPIPIAKLPPAEKRPAWLGDASKNTGADLFFRTRPQRLRAALNDWIECAETQGAETAGQLLHGMYADKVEIFEWSLTFRGELLHEQLRIAIAPTEAALLRTVQCLREKPASWDGLLAATPGDHDISLVLQTDTAALGADRAFAAQAFERYLRGRKWTRTAGRLDDALDATRYDFLLEQLEGSFAVVVKPALSGEMRMIVAAALKGGSGADAGAALRGHLVDGLRELGADFEPLRTAYQIGGCAPLGAKFQGRGMFASPVLGLCPGWAWLCTNSSAYQELVTAFKTGKTLAAAVARERNKPNAPEPAAPRDDAVRLQIQLEKAAKLAYASWLLSGDEGPFIGSWKVPGALLPQPQVFNGRLGSWHAGMGRKGATIEAFSTCAVPGVSLVLPGLLFDAADSIEQARRYTETARAPEPLPVDVQPADAKAPKATAPVFDPTAPVLDEPRDEQPNRDRPDAATTTGGKKP